ncbi:MAG: 4-alpha-glucanotransferase, partial [Oscillospiraceae bacterium]|nr:4-alpha-glucanotransferase [Oscillospiraceae bacterium]
MRKSGILMAMSSLPSPYGIGTMGKSAYRFVDFLRASGQTYWQLLPLGPTSYGDSPYSAFSTFAGNPYFIDLDLLVRDGLLKRDQLEGIDWGGDPQRVDYGKIYENRFPVLRRAFARSGALAGEIAAFRRENGAWLEDYALYMTMKTRFGMVSWTEWPDEDIRLHKPEAVARCAVAYADEVDFWVFLQFLFFRQWNALRDYAHSRGIQFIGDIPIYVALDSADVWSAPRFFQLDEKNVPKEVAGVPPDAFTEDGQLWGNPLYDWDAMRKDGFGWWIRRIEGAQKLYDVIRIDHFRGFESYWAVPYGDTTAKRGHWKPGPGMDLVGVLTGWFPNLRFIAEDLGYTTPEVEKLLADSGLPGMKILEFGFDPQGESGYVPHN